MYKVVVSSFYGENALIGNKLDIFKSSLIQILSFLGFFNLFERFSVDAKCIYTLNSPNRYGSILSKKILVWILLLRKKYCYFETLSQPAFIFSKLTIETLDEGVKYFQS